MACERDRVLAGHVLGLIWVCCHGNAHPVMTEESWCCTCTLKRADVDRWEWLANSKRVKSGTAEKPETHFKTPVLSQHSQSECENIPDLNILHVGDVKDCYHTRIFLQ